MSQVAKVFCFIPFKLYVIISFLSNITHRSFINKTRDPKTGKESRGRTVSGWILIASTIPTRPISETETNLSFLNLVVTYSGLVFGQVELLPRKLLDTTFEYTDLSEKQKFEISLGICINKTTFI